MKKKENKDDRLKIKLKVMKRREIGNGGKKCSSIYLSNYITISSPLNTCLFMYLPTVYIFFSVCLSILSVYISSYMFICIFIHKSIFNTSIYQIFWLDRNCHFSLFVNLFKNLHWFSFCSFPVCVSVLISGC